MKLFKVKHVWIFFVMQGVVYAFWLTEVIRLYNYGKVMLSDPYGMIAVLFIVGLFGGACYVNVMYSIISHQVLEFDEKELALNICTILDDVGIIGASVTALVLSNFVFIAPA
ncbi:MAG: hypothetical protein P4M11_14095 [Candidatus Pacebacteria bacterium]|nr:hypothetical protein [Candidatus Paceibacterota bacterium]